MIRAIFTFAACFLILETAAASGFEEDLSPTEPFQYWHDACGYPAVIPVQYAAQVNKLIDAEAILVPASHIVQRDDDPNYYRFTNHQAEHTWGDRTTETCQETPFRLEEKYDVSGRSGFLIAPDLIATASHTYDPEHPLDATFFTAVFGVAAHYVNGLCVPADPEHIPAANVFRITSNADTVNAQEHYYLQDARHTGVDYAVFRLGSTATGRPYLRIRRTGQPTPADNTISIGHPDRLGAKLFYGGKVVDFAQDSGVPPGFPAPRFDAIYFTAGSSGGPTYNLDRQYVEVVEANGLIGGECAIELLPGSPWNPIQTCEEVHDNCYEPITDPTFDASKPPFAPDLAPITLLAPLVDNGETVNTPELRVTPLQDVVYRIPLNGTPTPVQSTYSLKASHDAPTTSVTTVVSVPTGQPQLVTLSGFNGSLPADGVGGVTVTPSIPPNLGCGAYDHSLLISDVTHGFTDTIKHRFEIGLTEFSVAPAAGENIYGIASPSVPSQLTYTMTNLRPTAVNVKVTSPQPWIMLTPVGPASGTTFNLNPAGQSGSSRQINVSLTSSAFSLADGDYPIDVVFTNQSTCAVSPTLHAHPTFHKGLLLLEQDLGYVQIPIPTPPASPVTSAVTVPETFCVSDVALGLDNVAANQFFGEDFVDWAPHLKLNLDFLGGLSIGRTLWNGNAVPGTWPPIPVDTESDGGVIEYVVLNNTSNPPPTGVHMSDFNGRAANGQWRLSVWDDGGNAGRPPAELRRWKLYFRGVAGSCIAH
jgi:hypothetical protein